MKKFDMYCDWSIYGIGIVVVDSECGVYYKREETTNEISQQGEMEGVAMCLDIVEDLGLKNVTIHTDQEMLAKIMQGKCIKFKKSKKGTKEAFYGNAQRALDLGVKVVWVRSHNGNVFNNAADLLARKPNSCDYEARLADNAVFHNRAVQAVQASKPLPNMWDTLQAFLINLTHTVVL